MLDPNLSICAGIKWLFRKKELKEKKMGTPISWRDAIAEYKGVSPNDKLLGKFDRHYKELGGQI